MLPFLIPAAAALAIAYVADRERRGEPRPFTLKWRRLTRDEIEDAMLVFGDQIPYHRVRVAELDEHDLPGGSTKVSVLRFNSPYRILLQGSGQRRTLIHELAHVWQIVNYSLPEMVKQYRITSSLGLEHDLDTQGPVEEALREHRHPIPAYDVYRMRGYDFSDRGLEGQAELIAVLWEELKRGRGRLSQPKMLALKPAIDALDLRETVPEPVPVRSQYR